MQKNEKEILLETGTNEFEVLELFITAQETPQAPEEHRFFGINVAKVMQVIENPGLEQPDAASNPAFLGLISVRDKMVPVLDLSVMLDFPRAKNDYEVVIITEFSNTITGLLVSGVTDIHRLGWHQVEPPDRYLEHAARGVIVGMILLKDHFLQLLDMESLLAELNPEALAITAETEVKASKAYKALVADDSATIRVMLKKMLENAGFQLDIRNNGEEALQYLMGIKKDAEKNNNDVSNLLDIIIVDIEMPRIDGYSLTRTIKDDPVLKKIPVILYSSIIYDEVLHKGESVKADAQINKPDMPRMAAIALEILEKQPQALEPAL